MNNYYFILDENREPVETDMVTWVQWFEKANRTVAKTVIVPDKVEVSTVFLGMNHNFESETALGCRQPTPIVFETLVFGGPCDGQMNRYATWDEAEAGHADMVKEVKKRMEGSNVVPLRRAGTS